MCKGTKVALAKFKMFLLFFWFGLACIKPFIALGMQLLSIKRVSKVDVVVFQNELNDNCCQTNREGSLCVCTQMHVQREEGEKGIS